MEWLEGARALEPLTGLASWSPERCVMLGLGAFYVRALAKVYDSQKFTVCRTCYGVVPPREQPPPETTTAAPVVVAGVVLSPAADATDQEEPAPEVIVPIRRASGSGGRPAFIVRRVSQRVARQVTGRARADEEGCDRETMMAGAGMCFLSTLCIVWLMLAWNCVQSVDWSDISPLPPPMLPPMAPSLPWPSNPPLPPALPMPPGLPPPPPDEGFATNDCKVWWYISLGVVGTWFVGSCCACLCGFDAM